MAAQAPGKMNPQWWLLDKTDVAKAVFDTCAYMYQDQQGRRERNMRCARMYGNTDFLGQNTLARSITPQLPEDRVKYNIICSTADSICAKVSKMKPRVSFLTEDGSQHLSEQAQNLSKVVDGLFYKNDIYDLHRRAFHDGTILDIGALKHYIQDDEIVSERVLATELLVDDIDGMYGQPRSLYQLKFIHKEVLATAYPKKRASIMASAGNFDTTFHNTAGMEHYVLVVEAWHLPSGKDSGDGLHVICVEKDLLLYEDYEDDFYPFTFFRWSQRIVGFWGQSLADRLVGTQLEINKLLRFIQKAFHLGSAFKVFLEHGSKVAKEHLNNEVGAIVYYTGAKPEFYAPKVVNDEIFQHLKFLIQSAYEEAGISQLSATARKPAGIDSGKALREYNDIETERFSLTSQAYEATFLTTAHIYIHLMKKIKANGGNPEVAVESKRFLEKIKWSEVDLDHDQYIMRMFPVSMLPQTPAGRMQYVQELINEGFIDKDFGLKLLDFPDLAQWEKLKNAPIDDILGTIDDIVRNGKYDPPEPFQDLTNGIKLFQAAYLHARRQGVKEERLDLLRTWMTTAKGLLDQSQQAAQVQAGPTPGVQGGTPPPQPTQTMAV